MITRQNIHSPRAILSKIRPDFRPVPAHMLSLRRLVSRSSQLNPTTMGWVLVRVSDHPSFVSTTMSALANTVLVYPHVRNRLIPGKKLPVLSSSHAVRVIRQRPPLQKMKRRPSQARARINYPRVCAAADHRTPSELHLRRLSLVAKNSAALSSGVIGQQQQLPLISVALAEMQHKLIVHTFVIKVRRRPPLARFQSPHEARTTEPTGDYYPADH